MKPLRITIITFAWPPRNSIGAHRPLSWAKYWSEAGAEVCVLTAKKYSYDEPLDLEIPDLPGVKVIEVDYATGSTSLAAWVLQSPLGGLAQRIYQAIRSAGRSVVRNPREKWLDAARVLAGDLAFNSDVVVSTYDPRAVHEIASEMKQANPDLVWVADYRDLWSLNHAPSWNLEQRAKERDIEERTVVAHADLISSISPELAEQQGTFANKPWLCITNGFDVDLNEIQSALVAPKSRAARSIRLVYTGKLYKGLRDPSLLFEVIADMEDTGEISAGDIQVDIYGGQVDGIDEIMGSGRYDGFVTLHGHVTRDTALSAQRDADLLLLLESPKPEASGVLTGKIFEYMSSGVPILSLGSRRLSAIGEILKATATGLCTEEDSAEIRQALHDTLSGDTLNWFTPKIDEISRYSREAQAHKLLERIAELSNHMRTDRM